MTITADQLRRAMPGLTAARAAECLPGLLATIAEADLSTPKRLAAFLAQVGHESASLHYVREIASGDAYEGRRDLGNTQPGDGRRFKGRGFIQVTGRNNYGACGKALGLDLVNNPQMLETVDNAWRSAGWFWRTRGLNALADAGNFAGVTRKINGGTNGAVDRLKRYRLAVSALR